jgi:hypothetical protein
MILTLRPEELSALATLPTPPLPTPSDHPEPLPSSLNLCVNAAPEGAVDRLRPLALHGTAAVLARSHG